MQLIGHHVGDFGMFSRVRLQISNPIIQLQEPDHLLMLSTIVLQHLDATELLSILPVCIYKCTNDDITSITK